MMETWRQDVRYAGRLLRKSPLFAATVVLSLAIGIGATTTIFSLGDALLLRPVAGVADQGRLVDVGRTQEGRGFDTVSYPSYLDVRARTRQLDGLYAFDIEPEAMSIGGEGGPERVFGTVVSGNYFSVLGVRPRLGRVLGDMDDREGGPPVAVISDRLWARRFGSDRAILSRPIVLNGRPVAVVGVAPAGFQGTTLLASDVWLPIASVPDALPRLGGRILRERGSTWLVMGGRLKPAATIGQAAAELRAIGVALEREYPGANRGKGLAVARLSRVPGRVGVVAGFIGLLMGIAWLVLAVACVNVAGLLLARAEVRRHEIAVRLAVGAGRRRLIRQLLTETGVLVLGGGLMALLLARWITAMLVAVVPALPFPIALEIGLDWRVFLFAAALSLATAIFSGLVPALQASRPAVVPALQRTDRGGGSARLRLRNVLVVGQVTLSLVLLIAGALFLRALQHASEIPPGFDQRNVDVVSLDLSLAGYRDGSGEAFVRAVIERLRTTRGVETATAAADLPLDGSRMGLGGLRIADARASTGPVVLGADANIVEPGFFRTLRLPLRRGRDFSAGDASGSPRVAIVNEALARRAWPGQDPIGRRIGLEGTAGAVDEALTVVGVASDARLNSLTEPPEPYLYVPLAQHYVARVSLLVRSTGGGSVIPQVRAVVAEMNPNLPVTQALRLRDVTAIEEVPQRMAASFAGGLGLVGLLLAAVGIYGVTSFAVTSRRREIGIRMALGAGRGSVIRLALRQGLTLAGTGVAIGLAASAAMSRVLEHLLLGVSGLDPIAFAAGALLLAAATLVGSYGPARHAGALDPMDALRNE